MRASFLRWWQLYVVVGLVLGGPASAFGELPIRLRVLSYNIHHGEGVDRKLDLDRIAQVVSSARPDLVALQEVDQVASRSQSVDQPKELARLTGMKVAFGANIPLQGGHYGNAVLSRFPITRHQNHRLPNFDDGEQRGYLETEIQLSERAERITFLATHFDHRRDDRERIASAQALNEFVAGHPNRPTILAGDLNDVMESETLKRLHSVWLRTNATPLPTIPVGEPRRQIDFILCRPKGRWRVVDVEVLDESVASDHRAILAVLELLPAAQGPDGERTTGPAHPGEQDH